MRDEKLAKLKSAAEKSLVASNKLAENVLPTPREVVEPATKSNV